MMLNGDNEDDVDDDDEDDDDVMFHKEIHSDGCMRCFIIQLRSYTFFWLFCIFIPLSIRFPCWLCHRI